MSKRFLAFFLVTMGVFLTACGAPPTPQFRVSASGDDVDVRSFYRDGTVTFFIYNPSGIGGADITLTAGAMPETVQIRLFVHPLEQLEIAYDTLSINASAPAQANASITERLTQAGVTTDIHESDPHWLDIQALPPEAGGLFIGKPAQPPSFLITLPQDFHDGGYGLFSVHWIDQYR